MSKQCGKKMAVGRGPRGGGGPSHGTTNTMVNPALETIVIMYLFMYRHFTLSFIICIE